jgi:hypothetical protein
VLAQHAIIRHDQQASRFGAARRVRISGSVLHPNDLGAFADGGFDDLRHGFRPAEDLNDLDRPELRSRWDSPG